MHGQIMVTLGVSRINETLAFSSRCICAMP